MQTQTRKSILARLGIHIIESMTRTPYGTEEMLDIKRIAVPLSFIKSKPNPEKIKRMTKFYIDNGYFDKPITVQKNQMNDKSDLVFLRDGYIRYYIAVHNNMKTVPIRWYKKGENK